MPSLVWNRDPQEAFRNPYEYAIQEQFSREADKLLKGFYRLLNSDQYRFTREDQSVEKAIWLLQMDALDSLRDCLSTLSEKKHRITGKLFRDIFETLDLAAYFHGRTQQSERNLQKWYDDGVIPHRIYRDYLRKAQGEDAFEESRRHYQSLSRFTHRTYRIIMEGYVLGARNILFHDGTGLLYGQSKDSDTALVLPHTIASYYAVLANLILIFSDEIVRRGLVDVSETKEALQKSLEVETVPRRFMPREWLKPPKSSPKESSEMDEGTMS